MKNFIETLLAITLTCYFIISISAIFFGTLDKTTNSGCKKHKRNIELIFPTYRLGCWLSQRQ